MYRSILTSKKEKSEKGLNPFRQIHNLPFCRYIDGYPYFSDDRSERENSNANPTYLNICN